MHRPATFAALLGLTRAASAIGDFWVQNDFCARVKGASDDHPVTYEDPQTKEKTTHGTADGRRACLHHCLTYTATQAIVTGLGARALGIRVHPGAAAAALALSLTTHYIADRRVPGKGALEKLANKTGKTNFYKLADFGMNGAFHLDSTWHHGWETVAALIAATKATAHSRTRLERVRASVGIAQLGLQQIEDDLSAADVDQAELAAILRELIEDTDPPGGFIPAVVQLLTAAARRAELIEPDRDGEASCPLHEAAALITDNAGQCLIWAARALDPQGELA